MSLSIDSEALLYLKRILNMPGAGSSETILEDGSVTQVLDILTIARRSLTPVESSGIYIGVMENGHAGADAEASSIDPYNPGTTRVVRGYPAPVPAGLDVWLLRATILRTGGAGDLSGAQVRVGSTARGMGWGVNDAGVGITTATNQPVLAAFAVINAVTSGVHWAAELGTGKAEAVVGRRLRRGNDIVFESESGGAATFRAVLTLGLFPEALGQDVVV